MPNVYQIGRTGQCYSKAESSYGVAPVFASSDAIRHLMVKLDANPRNRVNAPDRYLHPSLLTRRTRRTTATWEMGGILFPSGTLNTAPDIDDILQAALGGLDNTTLATTFSGSPTATTGTVASATGLAAGKAVRITIASGGNAGVYVRWLTSGTVGTALVWAPALPGAPASGDALTGCLTYQLATSLPNALTVAHYLQSFSFESHGCVADMLKLTFDANDEARWDVSGPAAERIRNAQALPGAFTTVGSAPPSGLALTLRVGAAAFEILKLEADIANGMVLDNVAAGTSKAQNFYRDKQRAVTLAVDAMYSSDVTLLGAAEATTDQALLAQCGNVAGNIIAMYCPAVEFDVPTDPDVDGTMQLSFKGTAKGISGNDEFSLAFA